MLPGKILVEVKQVNDPISLAVLSESLPLQPWGSFECTKNVHARMKETGP